MLRAGNGASQAFRVELEARSWSNAGSEFQLTCPDTAKLLSSQVNVIHTSHEQNWW